jgi:hypothetical protein
MKDDIKLIIGQISIQIASLFILGSFLFGIYIFEPKYFSFPYTIYGISAILFYKYCRWTTLKNFILLGLLYSILMIVVFQRSYHMLKLDRNIIWFILIGLLSYYLTVIEKKGWYLKSKAWIVSYWLFGFIIIYIVMSFLNIYVFDFWPIIKDRYPVWLWLKQSVKIGGTLGISIGLGSLINTYIFKEKSTVH